MREPLKISTKSHVFPESLLKYYAQISYNHKVVNKPDFGGKWKYVAKTSAALRLLPAVLLPLLASSLKYAWLTVLAGGWTAGLTVPIYLR